MLLDNIHVRFFPLLARESTTAWNIEGRGGMLLGISIKARCQFAVDIFPTRVLNYAQSSRIKSAARSATA